MSSSGGVGGAGGGGGGGVGGAGGAGGAGSGSGGPSGASGTGSGNGGPSGASGTGGTSSASGASSTGETSGTSNANGVSASDMGDVSAAADSVSDSQVSAQADSVTGSAVDGFDRAESASAKGGPGVGPSEGAMAEADRRGAEAEAADKATADKAAADARAQDAALDTQAAEARTATAGRISESAQAEIDRRAENAKVEAIADRLATMSPTAAGLLSSFRAQDGVFERSAKGGWFNTVDGRPTIGVPAGTELQNMRTIAHELGHFGFVGNPQGAYSAPGLGTGVTDRQMEHQRQADYIGANTNARLADEGNATLANKTIRDEVMAATGLDIGVSGFPGGTVGPMGVGTLDQQRAAIGDFFGTNLTTSTTGQNYRSYYGEAYRDFYEGRHLPGQE